MYCDTCGEENRIEAKYCHKCGHTLFQPGLKNAATEAVSTSSAIDESTRPEELSEILGGRYELKEMLGRGGMGIVYRAYDRQLGMDVAIKFLLDRFVDNFVAIECLKREARAAMKLAHPNIIHLYNFENTADAKYLLMEYVRGESLASIAARRSNRQFSDVEVIRYVSKVCEALKYSHSENVIHRDIKPSNILVTSEGRVKLADFGVAFINEAATSNPGEVAGTPTYMSPEQILGQKLDGRSDIYSVGVTMYEMLAGKPPFSGGDVSYQHIHVMPERIRGLSDWMNAVVLKCLRKDPEGRWQDAEELKDVLAGKKEIGINLQGRYQPEWLRVEVQRHMEPPNSPLPDTYCDEIKSPNPARVAVRKTPRPSSAHRLKERVGNIQKHAGLVQHTPEREHARMGLSTVGGIAGGIVIMALERNGHLPIPEGTLAQLSWILYGGLIGLAIGIAQKRTGKSLLSLSLGMMGGLVAAWLLNATGGIPSLGELRPAYFGLLCGTLVGAFLGISDGIYEKSFGYTIRCLLWSGLGGAVAVAFSLAARYLFSAFWSPLFNWMVVGAALGFFINFSVGFAERPCAKDFQEC